MLAHLAMRPGGEPERLATEMLQYLLARSPVVGDALVAVCAVAEPGLENVGAALQFRAAGGEGAAGRAVLLGREAGGPRREAGGPGREAGSAGREAGSATHEADVAARIVVDCRFWSPLSELAPLDVLGLLAAERPSVLLLVAPQSRFTSLWADLRRRCRLGGLPVHGDRAAGDSLRWTRVGRTRTMMLVSWGTVLAGVHSRLAAANDEPALAELDRLAALCDVQDGTVFAPLGTADLAVASARRLAQLYGLVDGLGRACEELGLGSVAPPGPSTIEAPVWAAEPGAHGFRLRLGTCVFELGLSLERWATLRDTPFWLLVCDPDGQPARWAEARLERLGSEIPPRLLRDAETGGVLVPLFPPIGVGREAVLAGLAEQVSEVARLLGESPTTGFGSAD
jgi:hypothetical protein